MMTLEQIVSSNLAMLKEQEASLMKSLDFIQKVKQLFESGGKPGTAGKTNQKKSRKKRTTATKVARQPKSSAKAICIGTGGKHIDRIIALLKEKKQPISSGELLEGLFNQQKADKDEKHFGTLIYPVLTKAYKVGVLKSKGGKIHLPS